MKILYVNVIELNAQWGAEYFVNKGFLNNGHSTITLDYRKYRHRLVKQLLSIDEPFDVFFLQRGDFFPLELIKSVNTPRFFWASELVSRCRDQDRLLSSKLFDHIFVHSSSCKDTIINKQWQPEDRISVLLNGFDTHTHYKMPGLEKDIEVLFIGNLTERRKRIIRYLKSKGVPIQVMSLYGKEMTNAFNRAKIILNIHAAEYLDTETRIFEALGCGAFVITEKLSPENPFTPKQHLIEVYSPEEMIEKIQYFLKHEKERNQIAENGCNEALARHNYAIRAKEIIEIFSRYITDRMTDVPLDKKRIKKYIFREKINKALDLMKSNLFRVNKKTILK